MYNRFYQLLFASSLFLTASAVSTDAMQIERAAQPPVFSPPILSPPVLSQAVPAEPATTTAPAAPPTTPAPTNTPVTRPSVCPAPTTYTVPSVRRRTVAVEDWNVSFEVPTNYRALRAGNTIQVLSPESFVHFQCRRAHRITDENVPTGITVGFLEGAATEETIRRQSERASGSFLGETEIDGGSAFVHTSHIYFYAVHLSRPTPDQKNTVMFTSILSDDGEIFYEETFDIVRGTFTFKAQ
ncbi:MAG: hypothetical protein AAF171_20595 [Cyanobacteria bacterium P01_A01_bin.116]